MKTPAKAAKTAVKSIVKKNVGLKAAPTEVIESKDAPATDVDEQTQRIINVRKVMRERDRCRLETEDFAKSDILRERLRDLGVDVIDQKNGPSGWKFIDGSSNKLKAGTSVPDDAIRKRNVAEVSEPQAKPTKSGKTKTIEEKPEVQSSSTKHGTFHFAVIHLIRILHNLLSSNFVIIEKDEQQRNKALLTGVLGKGQSSAVRVIQGVKIEDISIGTGRKAESGKKLKMHYVGRLKSTNNVFDSSKNKPFAFRLGRSEVIRGWDIGVEGMLVGGKRILTIPPEKGYGKGGAPPTIPGNATLVFEVTLLEVN